MVIIGITGGIRHGKTTLSGALAKVEPNCCQFETYELVAEVANELHKQTSEIPIATKITDLNKFIGPLPGILKDITRISCPFSSIKITQEELERDPVAYQKLIAHLKNLKADPGLLNQPIVKDNKEKYRPILQWLGGYLVAKVDKRIWYGELLRRIKASDCQLSIIGGVRFPSDELQVHEAGGIIIEIQRPGYKELDSVDPTESQRGSIKSDCKVLNDTTIAALENVAAVILRDIKRRQLQKIYAASSFV